MIEGPSFKNAPEMKESLPNHTERPVDMPKTLKEQYIDGLVGFFDDHPVDVLPKTPKITAEELRDIYPDVNNIVACDFYVEGAEDGTPIEGGIQMGNITNIDHHANLDSMKRHVSSTNLALEYVKTYGAVPEEDAVCINHIDADSFLSACIVRGFLSPQDVYGEAAIAGDHTGQSHDIADFLGPLGQIDKEGNEKFRYVLKNWLIHLLNDPELKVSKQITSLLEKEEKNRREASELVESGVFQRTDSGIHWAEIEKRIESSYFAAELPEAVLIVLFTPGKKDSGKTIAKIRLGNAAPQGFDIKKIKPEEFDPSYGGRWNAGSNSRGGGAEIRPDDYISQLDVRVKTVLSKLGQ